MTKKYVRKDGTDGDSAYIAFILIVLWIVVSSLSNTEEKPLLDFESKYRQAVYSTVQDSSEVIDLCEDTRNKVIIDKDKRVAHVLLEGDNIIFVSEESNWEYKAAVFSTQETINLYKKYKLEYGITKMIIYHNHWSTVSIPPTTNSIASVVI